MPLPLPSPPPTLAWLRRIAAPLLAVCLVACGEAVEPFDSAAASARPADPALAHVYDSSCKICHAVPSSGAPLTGHRQAWQPRLAKGMPTLLDHTIHGFQNMPPMGLCMHCSEAQFQALIDFMSSTPQP